MSTLRKIGSLLVGALSAQADWARRVAHHNQLKLVAKPTFHDDVYVVSYPKSGATWMDFLIANLHLKYSGLDKQVTFFNIHQIIPDINASNAVRADALSMPNCRVFKSHSEFNPYYQHIIYVVRDPRDVMISYFNFLKGLGQFGGSLSELLRSKEFGIQSWRRHVEGWFSKSSPSMRMWLIRYEDLKLDPHRTIARLYAQLGFTLKDDILASAIECSSFENMRRLESEYGYGERELGRNFTFMRKGVKGGWKDEMDATDVEYIDSVAGHWMKNLGYK